MSPTQSANLYENLYVSTIAADASAAVVSEIIAKARFREQMEGREVYVVAQLALIEADTRHSHLQVFHQGPLFERRFSRFSMGYTTLDDDDALAQLETLRGQDAVDAFLKLLSSLDLDA